MDDGMKAVDRVVQAVKALAEVTQRAARGFTLFCRDVYRLERQRAEKRRIRKQRERELLAIIVAIIGQTPPPRTERINRYVTEHGLEVQFMLKDVPREAMPTPEMVSSMAHQLGLRLESVSIVGDEGRVTVRVSKGEQPEMVIERCSELARQLGHLASERVHFDVLPRFDGAPEA